LQKLWSAGTASSSQMISGNVLLKPYGVGPGEMATRNALMNNAETFEIYNAPTDQAPVALAHLDKGIALGLQPFNEGNWNEIQEGARETGLVEETGKDLLMGEAPLPGKVAPAVAESPVQQAPA